MSRLISRDPFARTELHCERVHTVWIDPPHYTKAKCTCTWCGSVAKARAGHPYLNRYWTETDGGRRHDHKGEFCSVSCFRSYHS